MHGRFNENLNRKKTSNNEHDTPESHCKLTVT